LTSFLKHDHAPLCSEQGAQAIEPGADPCSPFKVRLLLHLAGTLERLPTATGNTRILFSLHEGMRGKDHLKEARRSLAIEVETFKLHIREAKRLRLFLRARNRSR
jgi:hypothetical protein